MTVVAGIVALLLLGYLVVALVQPERFGSPVCLLPERGMMVAPCQRLGDVPGRSGVGLGLAVARDWPKRSALPSR